MELPAGMLLEGEGEGLCARIAAGATRNIPLCCSAQVHLVALGFEQQTGRWSGLYQTSAVLFFQHGAGHTGW